MDLTLFPSYLQFQRPVEILSKSSIVCTWENSRVIIFGQILSFLLACNRASQATLCFKCSLGEYPPACACMCVPWVCILDVMAIFSTVMAYRYTTLTSVFLFDTFAIRRTMVFLTILLNRRFSAIHLLEVARWILMAVVISAVCEREMIAQFLNGFESDTEDKCPVGGAVLLTSAFVALSTMMYVGMARFLSASEATLLNLSLLTSDAWAVLFSVAAQKYHPTPLFLTPPLQ
jgi:hypothetical protein